MAPVANRGHFILNPGSGELATALGAMRGDGVITTDGSAQTAHTAGVIRAR